MTTRTAATLVTLLRNALDPLSPDRTQSAERFASLLRRVVDPPDSARTAESAIAILTSRVEFTAPGTDGEALARLAFTPKAKRNTLWTIAAHMAQRMPAALRGDSATRALRDAARAARLTPTTYLREHLFPASMLLALDDMLTPQPVRLGKRWIVGADGAQRTVIPAADLTLREFRQWLLQRAYQRTRDALDVTSATDDALMPSEQPILDRDGHPDTPLALFERDEADRQERKAFATLWRRATPRERKFLHLLHTGFDAEKAGKTLKLSPDALRKLRSRLRQKFSR